MAPWQRRTKVWREATSPARGFQRLTSDGSAAQFLLALPTGGVPVAGSQRCRSFSALWRREFERKLNMSWRWEPVYLKKAKPLDGLLREPPARHDLPGPNPVRPGPGPEDRLRNLRRGFRAVSARHDRASKRRYYRSVKIAALAAIVAFAVSWGLLSSPWPVTTTLRHIAAAPNCGFARFVGLAPARRGEPGYWKSHDRDRDGIACEPWPPHSGRR